MQRKIRDLRRQMKASELAQEAGIASSAIRYYLALGLLHPPNKVGLNLQFYDETHLTRLRQIRQLKERKGLSLAEIAKIFEKNNPPTRRDLLKDGEAENPAAAPLAGAGSTEGTGTDQENREKILILDMAIKLFSERGFESTKISDITEKLRMGKSTFYVYFKNKRELFMECIDRLAVTIVPRESWAEIRSEQDFFRKGKKRGVAFLKAFPGYRGILNEIRGAVGGSDPVMARKASEAFRVLSRPMLKDLRRAVAEGRIRIRHDEALIAYLQLVLAEGLGYWQMIDPRYSVEEGAQIVLDLIQHGFMGAPRPQTASGEIEDSTGMKTRLREIAFNGDHVLRGRLGDSEVEVDVSRLAIVKLRENAGRLRAELTTKQGEALEIEVDGEIPLSGAASFGSFRIPLKRVRSVSFGEG
ncbi:MAG: MerR family transcriptional regulator [bacterium]